MLSFHKPRRGAFVDSSGVRWDPNDADYEGWLSKKSRWIGEWRQRYFILKGSKLFYAKSSVAAPHGVIDLVDCKNIQSADTKTKKRNAFIVSLKEDQIFLFAENENLKDTWISQLGRAILYHSSLYTSENNGFEWDDNNDEKTNSESTSNSLPIIGSNI
mmetsp:Transcript_24085/g.21908  ORF Transcript_24085/g.21908 Transcript_24085/m.21908 type:complete len:159 (+) Transcript_24085:74-550(+)